MFGYTSYGFRSSSPKSAMRESLESLGFSQEEIESLVAGSYLPGYNDRRTSPLTSPLDKVVSQKSETIMNTTSPPSDGRISPQKSKAIKRTTSPPSTSPPRDEVVSQKSEVIVKTTSPPRDDRLSPQKSKNDNSSDSEEIIGSKRKWTPVCELFGPNSRFPSTSPSRSLSHSPSRSPSRSPLLKD